MNPEISARPIVNGECVGCIYLLNNRCCKAENHSGRYCRGKYRMPEHKFKLAYDGRRMVPMDHLDAVPHSN